MLRKQTEDTSSHWGATKVAPQRYWPSRKRVACQGKLPSVLGKVSHPPRFGRIPHSWLLHVKLTNLQSLVVEITDCRLAMKCSAVKL